MNICNTDNYQNSRTSAEGQINLGIKEKKALQAFAK
jgi:hypothetical protein